METECSSQLESELTWADSLIFCSKSPPTRLYFSIHNANDSADFLDFSSAWWESRGKRNSCRRASILIQTQTKWTAWRGIENSFYPVITTTTLRKVCVAWNQWTLINAQMLRGAQSSLNTHCSDWDKFNWLMCVAGTQLNWGSSPEGGA